MRYERIGVIRQPFGSENLAWEGEGRVCHLRKSFIYRVKLALFAAAIFVAAQTSTKSMLRRTALQDKIDLARSICRSGVDRGFVCSSLEADADWAWLSFTTISTQSLGLSELQRDGSLVASLV